MLLEFLSKGILIGFLASIPMGPVGVICIQRTLSKNFRTGFASALGATLGDLIFAMIAAFFLSFILSFIENYMTIIKGIGGILVIIIGISIYNKNIIMQIRNSRAGRNSLWSDFISMLLLTLSNISFLFVFVALFAAFGINEQSGMKIRDGVSLVSGVGVGSALWWFLLTFTVGLFRKKFRPRHLLWLNKISGALIVLLGAVTIISMLWPDKIPNIRI